MEFKDVGVIISGLALLAAFINNVVRYSNADTIELILMNTKDRNAAAFYQFITSILSFAFVLSIFFYQLTSEKNIFMTVFSGIGSFILIIIIFRLAFVKNVYFFYKEATPYKIISRIDNDYLLVAYRENKKIRKKIVPLSLIDNKNLYVSKKMLLDKDYTVRQINKKLKIN
ncbi:hypothetical protein CI088_11050 [Enterococcus plantarum]|uniref:Uncharacterized protein n=1 Tax=Enterococcus plantarum TaxID=1077675 RepID=A0A2W3Z4A6_9ENTE|nr:hypothetical protein [Enterococcus plantarum]PZL72140.1 hypothetical protein CI088_11050 [Enterococcus plantarum]